MWCRREAVTVWPIRTTGLVQGTERVGRDGNRTPGFPSQRECAPVERQPVVQPASIRNRRPGTVVQSCGQAEPEGISHYLYSCATLPKLPSGGTGSPARLEWMAYAGGRRKTSLSSTGRRALEESGIGVGRLADRIFRPCCADPWGWCARSGRGDAFQTNSAFHREHHGTDATADENAASGSRSPGTAAPGRAHTGCA